RRIHGATLGPVPGRPEVLHARRPASHARVHLPRRTPTANVVARRLVRAKDLLADEVIAPALLHPLLWDIRTIHPDAEVPLRLTHGAALRDDLDHAGRRLCAIQRRRRRALDHLDVVDVVGIEAVQASGLLCAADVHEAIVDANAVDVDERLIALV